MTDPGGLHLSNHGQLGFKSESISPSRCEIKCPLIEISSQVTLVSQTACAVYTYRQLYSVILFFLLFD